MHKPRMMKFYLVSTVSILVFSILTGCTMNTPTNVCHATDDPANPYQEVNVTSENIQEHIGHPNDIIPVPVGGCPTVPVVIVDGKIAICHATSSETNPYNEISISVNGLNGHAKHENDLIPVPDGGCPTTLLDINAGKTTICHATDDPANPYQVINGTSENIQEHIGHPNDLIPVPVSGCPTVPVVIVDGKIAICHATSSETNPYNEISISVNGLNGHAKHEGDLIPVPEDGCPTTLVDTNAGKTTICHATDDPANPYQEINGTSENIQEHVSHPNDIIPVPVNGCPTVPVVIVDGKIAICHATSSETNPYNEVSISVNGLNGHDKHEGDLIPVPESGCPTTLLDNNAGKITICHATSSEKNPYNEITISINGLSGHDKHDGDIIPVPEGGCPATRQ